MENKGNREITPAENHPCTKCKGWIRRHVSIHIDRMTEAKEAIEAAKLQDSKVQREATVMHGVDARAEGRLFVELYHSYFASSGPCGQCGDIGLSKDDSDALLSLADELLRCGQEFESESGQSISYGIKMIDY